MATVGTGLTLQDTGTVLGYRVSEMNRVIPVTGLTQSSSSWQTEAIYAVQQSVPPWSLHPKENTIPNLMRAVAYEAEGLSGNSCNVHVKYINSDYYFLQGQTSLEVNESDIDYQGNSITVSNLGAPTTTIDSKSATTYTTSNCSTIPVTIPKLIPICTFSITRYRPIQSSLPGWIAPLVEQSYYTGKLNASQFLDWPAGYVMCVGVQFNNDSLGDVAMKMTYIFNARPIGYKYDAVFPDPDNPKNPYKGLVLGVGRKQVQMQEFANFNPIIQMA